MVINPQTPDYYKQEMAENIERVRSLIRELPREIKELIDKGERTIDEHFRFVQGEIAGGRLERLELNGLNVFNLREDIPADVMKHLAMLYCAGGWEHACIVCNRFSSEGVSMAEQVMFPNTLTLKASR